MDYCSSCRRTLNGALVCPGCGAYAPDIAPPGHRLHHNTALTTVTAVETWRTPEPPAPVPASALIPALTDYDDSPHLDAGQTGPGDMSEAATESVPAVSDAGPPSGSEHTAPATEGRAARRRQLARWKKQRRRAAVASTVALVGGGLTLAVLPSRPSTGHDAQASSTPEPKATATTLADATDTDSSSVRPRARDPRDSGTDGHPSAITGPPRRTTTVLASTTTKSPRGTTATRPAATTDPKPRTTPAATAGTPTTNPAPPQTTTPPPAEPSSPTDNPTADTPPPNPAPSTESPDRICLLVLCVG
ncbi:hypothetical protein ACFRR7_36945 [Streptomyces sp. NPDC056909]|uniref:SCO2400 family protein n=1 Tax=Streptomyces sp. NPDC056909 TaxID=3345963 RepID=UPI00367A6D69